MKGHNIQHRAFRRMVRELNKMTPAERRALAEKADVAPMTPENWVKGRVTWPHLRTLTSLGSALGWDLDWRT